MSTTAPRDVCRLWQRSLHGRRSLPEICASLHQILAGDGPPWTEDRIRNTIELLETTRKTWVDRPRGNTEYDQAVKKLLDVVLQEAASSDYAHQGYGE